MDLDSALKWRDGIFEVIVDVGGKTVTVRYDVLTISLDSVASILTTAGSFTIEGTEEAPVNLPKRLCYGSAAKQSSQTASSGSAVPPCCSSKASETLQPPDATCRGDAGGNVSSSFVLSNVAQPSGPGCSSTSSSCSSQSNPQARCCHKELPSPSAPSTDDARRCCSSSQDAGDSSPSGRQTPSQSLSMGQNCAASHSPSHSQPAFKPDKVHASSSTRRYPPLSCCNSQTASCSSQTSQQPATSQSLPASSVSSLSPYLARPHSTLSTSPRVAPHGVLEFTMNIGGMTCASCVRLIEGKLAQKKGVSSVRVELLTSKGTVAADPRQVDDKALVSWVTSLGFTAEVISQRMVVEAPAQRVETEVSLSVGGMTCASCVRVIEDHLAQKRGVLSVCVELLTCKAVVVVDKDVIDDHGLASAITSLGFTADVISIRSRECLCNSDDDQADIGDQPTSHRSRNRSRRRQTGSDKTPNATLTLQVYAPSYLSHWGMPDGQSSPTRGERRRQSSTRVAPTSHPSDDDRVCLSVVPALQRVTSEETCSNETTSSVTASYPPLYTTTIQDGIHKASQADVETAKAAAMKLPGVSGVIANLSRSTLCVSYNPLTIGARDLIQRLRSARVGCASIVTQAGSSSNEETAKREYLRVRRDMVCSLIPTALVVLLSWLGRTNHVPPFLQLSILPGITLLSVLLLVFSVPVQFVWGKRFHVSAYKAARHGSFTMDLLVSINTNLAFFYSVSVLIYTGVVFSSTSLSVKTTFLAQTLTINGMAVDQLRDLESTSYAESMVGRYLPPLPEAGGSVTEVARSRTRRLQTQEIEIPRYDGVSGYPCDGDLTERYLQGEVMTQVNEGGESQFVDVPHFFDTSVLLITVILLGKTIEHNAKRQTLKQLDKLTSSQPQMARIMAPIPSSSFPSLNHPHSPFPSDILQGSMVAGESNETDETHDGTSLRLAEFVKEKLREHLHESSISSGGTDGGDGRHAGPIHIHLGEEMREALLPVELVHVGDLLKLYPGDIVPVDGTKVDTGNMTVDESIITGESAPVLKSGPSPSSKRGANLAQLDTLRRSSIASHSHLSPTTPSNPITPSFTPAATHKDHYISFDSAFNTVSGAESVGSTGTGCNSEPSNWLMAGSCCLVGTGVLHVEQVGDSTTLGQIITMVGRAQASKVSVQQMADKIAKVFVPCILLITLVTWTVWFSLVFTNRVDVPHASDQGVSAEYIVANKVMFAMKFGIAVLAIACPCALGLATPTATVVAVGWAAHCGILLRAFESLQTGSKIKVVVLDKTGTITMGFPSVLDAVLDVDALKRSNIQNLFDAVHPLADDDSETVDLPFATDFMGLNNHVVGIDRSSTTSTVQTSGLASPRKGGGGWPLHWSSSGNQTTFDTHLSEDSQGVRPTATSPSNTFASMNHVRRLSPRSLYNSLSETHRGADTIGCKIPLAAAHNVAKATLTNTVEKVSSSVWGMAGSAYCGDHRMDETGTPAAIRDTYVSDSMELLRAVRCFWWCMASLESASDHPIAKGILSHFNSSPHSTRLLNSPPIGAPVDPRNDNGLGITAILQIPTQSESAQPPSRSHPPFDLLTHAVEDSSTGCIGTRTGTSNTMNFVLRAGRRDFVTTPVARQLSEQRGKVGSRVSGTSAKACEEGGESGTKQMREEVDGAERRQVVEQSLTEWASSHQQKGGVVVWLSVDQVLVGGVAMRDKLQPNASEAVKYLREKLGMEVWMCSGDNTLTARAIGSCVGIPIDHVVGDAMPTDKVDLIRAIRMTPPGRYVAMVGDGVNDSPALAEANVGLAMWAGASVTAAAADATLMRSNLEDLISFFELSKAAKRTIWRNFIWAFAFNICALPVAAGVFYPITIPPAVGAASMACSSILVVLSSLCLSRLRRVKLGRKLYFDDEFDGDVICEGQMDELKARSAWSSGQKHSGSGIGGVCVPQPAGSGDIILGTPQYKRPKNGFGFGDISSSPRYEGILGDSFTPTATPLDDARSFVIKPDQDRFVGTSEVKENQVSQPRETYKQ
eukprot:GHVN01059661.1.p1 GENE.GHVN01059661.1~~GHVN01059661.1.p1  ORF type:complete len:2013 (+),score=339.62 GHVN01059661.1:113-6151(+)